MLNSETSTCSKEKSRQSETKCIVATPAKRHRIAKSGLMHNLNSSPVMDILSVHTKARLNQMCSLEVGVMRVCEKELRTLAHSNPKTVFHENVAVGQLHLADEEGIIACTFWRSVAKRHWDDFLHKVDDSCPADMVAFYRLTQLRVSGNKAPSLTPLKKLNSTDQTIVEFLDFRPLKIYLHNSLVLMDFGRLQRPVPYVTCLEGVVAEPVSHRPVTSGCAMCSFALVRNGVSVPCVAMGANAEHEWLRCNAVIMIVGALGQDDSQRPGTGNGALWLHDDVFVMKTGQLSKAPRILRTLILP